MRRELGDQALAESWADVTDLEQIFGILRDELGLARATRALVSILETKDASWRTERLAVAVAALDDVRREDAR